MENHIIFEKLDVTGHKCPIPVLRLRRFLERIPKGAIIKIIASDPMTQIDFPHFCHESGNIMISSDEDEGNFQFLIKKSGV